MIGERLSSAYYILWHGYVTKIGTPQANKLWLEIPRKERFVVDEDWLSSLNPDEYPLNWPDLELPCE